MPAAIAVALAVLPFDTVLITINTTIVIDNKMFLPYTVKYLFAIKLKRKDSYPTHYITQSRCHQILGFNSVFIV